MTAVVSHGRNIHYQDAGTGTSVVMVHSGGMSSRQWSRLTARLVDHHRVVAPDLLGSGTSDPIPRDDPFDYHQDVDALDAVLAVVDAPIHLVGHSYGGLVALTSARARPERVLSLSLYEPVAFGVLYSSGEREAVNDLESFDPHGTFFDDAAGGNAAWLERFIDYWNGRGAWQALPESSRATFLATGRKVFQEVRSLTSDRTPHDVYASLRMPTLLMTGERSTLAAQRVCAVLARTIPGATLVRFDGVGHMGPLTHAGLVNDRIVAHVARIDGA